MKNKFRFIMPRLLGATAIVGLAALVITTLFKLLLGLTLLAGGITLIARAIGKRQRHLGRYGQDPFSGFANRDSFGNTGIWASPVQPFTGYTTRKGTTIVPIN